MASKKEKYLESAQRFMLKGQLDKAIKDYQQVVALEPKEIRYRQKLAELLVRDCRKEEAIAQYEDIGKHYADNSYFLKAIAVYKQIQRLSPNDTKVALTLASLNHKQGLVGNAMAEYGQVVAQLEKEGDRGEALKVVEQMVTVDGEHVATRLKHAELLFATGAADASYQAFGVLQNLLQKTGDSVALKDVSARIAKLFPEQQSQGSDPVALQVSSEAVDSEISLLEEKLKADSGNLQTWQMLCDAQRRSGDRAGMKQSYRRMADLFPGDAGVLEEAIRCEIESGDWSGALSLSERGLACFVEQGAQRQLEELLLSVPTEVAGSPGLKKCLRRLYEATGDAGKLAALDGPDAAGAPAPLPGAPSKGSATPFESQEPPQSFPWEEEIELDLDQAPHRAVAPSAEAGLPQDLSLPLDLDADLPAEPSSLPTEESSPFGELPALEEHDPAAFEQGAAAAETSPFADEPVEASPFGDELAPFAAASPTAEEPSPFASSINDLSCFMDAPEGVAGEQELLPLDLEDEALAFDMPESSELFSDDGNGGTGGAGSSSPAEVEPVEQGPVADGEGIENPLMAAGEGVEQSPALEAEPPAAVALAEPEPEEEIASAEAVSAEIVAEPENLPLRGWEEIYPENGGSADPVEDHEELETHFDLGVGYKEMGMYGKAIKEFAVAAGNPQRRLDCLTLQAMCYREMGKADQARELLEQGLGLDVLSEEERVSISYELAYLFETTGDIEDAIRLYREAYRVNPAFHDVVERLAQLSGEEPLDVIDLDLEEADL